MYPEGLHEVGAALPALALMIIPAVLMVSTIRFRSFKSIDLRWRRSSRVLLPLALFLVAIATHPRWTLLVLAYSYLLSAFIAMAAARIRRRAAPAGEPVSAPPPPESPPAG